METSISPFFYAFAMSAAVTALFLALLWYWRNKLPLAYPNHRSLHQQPVPRVAALALWAGFAVGVTLLASFRELAQFAVLLGGLAVLIVVSLLDDCVGVAPIYRLLIQTAVAAALVFSWLMAMPEHSFLTLIYALVSVFGIVWMTNLFNFMDGSDDLAATMTITGFAALAAAAWLSGLVWWWLPALIVTTMLPLWCINFPPAKMFLGDVGAVPLGFLVATFGGMGIVAGQWDIFFVLLVFLPFILDATLTLLRRLWRREKIWEAHKTHFYQKLVQTGAGHRGTLLIYGALMAGCALTAVSLFQQSNALRIAFAVWLIIHLALFATIDHNDKKATK